MRNQIKIDIMRFCKFHWSHDEPTQEIHINAIYQQALNFKPAIKPNSHLSHIFIVNRCKELHIEMPDGSISDTCDCLTTTSIWYQDDETDIKTANKQQHIPNDSHNEPNASQLPDSKPDHDQEIIALKQHIKHLENQLKAANGRNLLPTIHKTIPKNSQSSQPSTCTTTIEMTMSRTIEPKSISPAAHKSVSLSSTTPSDDLPIALSTNNIIDKSDHPTIDTKDGGSNTTSKSKGPSASLDIPMFKPLPFTLHLRKTGSTPKSGTSDGSIANSHSRMTNNAHHSPKTLVVEPSKFSRAQQKAWNNRVKNPNEFYYRFSAKIIFEDDEKQKKVCSKLITGSWTDEEHKLFMQRVRSLGVNGHWGVFSMAIPTRVGYSCSQYWQKLIKLGDVQDMNFCEARNTNKQYPFIWKWKNTSRKDIQELEDAKHFSFTIIKDHSGVWKNLPAEHPQHPGKYGFQEIERKYHDHYSQKYIEYLKRYKVRNDPMNSPLRKRRKLSQS